MIMAVWGSGPDDPATIVAANPVTVDHSELRRSLLPGLLHVLADNQRLRRTDVAVFEVGPTHLRVDGQPTETPMLGIVLAGTSRPATWASAQRSFDVADGKGLTELLTERLGEAGIAWQPVDPRPGVDHPGRTALAVADAALASAQDTIPLGRVGEVHPALLAAYDIRAPHVVFAELSLDALKSLVPERVTHGRPRPASRDRA